MANRIKELDYLKCIFILLMIVFHLVYIGDKYPYAKQIVYTFHIPAFLMISGYLVNIGKNMKPFFKSMLWIFIPYAVMEISYVVMSALLPVREKVAEVTPFVLLEKTFMAPMGPYWYLHTLVLCSITYYLIYKFCGQMSNISRFIILGTCFFILSHQFQLLAFSSAVYFMSGVAVYQSRLLFTSIFQPSALSIIPLIILCCFPENLDRGSLPGIVITYLVVSALLFLYRYIPTQIKKFCHFIGRNTLVILLFSPIFTILSKAFIPFFAFDPSGMCFMLVAVSFVIAGCLSIAWITDKLSVSRFCFGKKRILQPIEIE